MVTNLEKEIEKLKRLREVAHTKFKRKATILRTEIGKESNPNTLRRCFEDLEKSYDQLGQKHEELIGKLCQSKDHDSELGTEEAFMEEIDKLKVDVTSAYDDKVCDKQNITAVKPKIKVKPINPPIFN